MTLYDYLAIAFYAIFMLSLGKIYKRFSITASDFYRGGGSILWWVVGSSSFMTTFSAWSFTGGAGKVYETGTFFLILFVANLVALVITYFFTAARFRQMRVITPIEGVQKRYGNLNEQIFTWLPLFFRILAGGITIYAVAIFLHGVFNIDISIIIIGIGIIATVMTLMGGAWAATAGDFIQMLVVLSITLLMALLSIWHPLVGGPVEFVQKIPEHHLNWSIISRPWVIIFFIAALFINQAIQMNSMLEGAAKYIFVKNGNEAKKAVLFAVGCFLLTAPIWIIPPMAATIVYPDLSVNYPALNNPSEAAYVAMAADLLPRGLLGVMVCAIFAASMTSLNSWLNIIAGTFVRNFWIRKIEINASESKQILVGRVCILIYGLFWIITALIIKDIENLKLFDLVMIAAASIGIPAAVPLFLGIFIKRTPSWSAWSTLVIGSLVAIALRLILKDEFIQSIFDVAKSFNSQELADINIAMTAIVLSTTCIFWYFFTMIFYNEKNRRYTKKVSDFFDEINKEIRSADSALEIITEKKSDFKQAITLSKLCLYYGFFIQLLLFVPNGIVGRASIFGCGMFLILVSFIIRRYACSNAQEIKDLKYDNL